MVVVIDPRLLTERQAPQFSALDEGPDAESELRSALETAIRQGDEEKARELDLAMRSLRAFKDPRMEVPTAESRLSGDIQAAQRAGEAPPALIQEQPEGSELGGILEELLSRRMGSPEAEALGAAGPARPPRGADIDEHPISRDIPTPLAGPGTGAPTETPTVYVGRGAFLGSGATQEEAEASLAMRQEAGVTGVEGLTPGAIGTLDVVPAEFDVTLDPEGRGFVAGEKIPEAGEHIFPDEETARLSEYIDAQLEVFDTKFSRDNYNKLTQRFIDDPQQMAEFNRGWMTQMALAEQDAGVSVKDLRSMRFKIDLGTSATDIMQGKVRTQLSPSQQLLNSDLTRVEKRITELQKQSKDLRSPAPGTERFNQKQALNTQIAQSQARADSIRRELGIAGTSAPAPQSGRTAAADFLSQF